MGFRAHVQQRWRSGHRVSGALRGRLGAGLTFAPVKLDDRLQLVRSSNLRDSGHEPVTLPRRTLDVAGSTRNPEGTAPTSHPQMGHQAAVPNHRCCGFLLRASSSDSHTSRQLHSYSPSSSDGGGRDHTLPVPDQGTAPRSQLHPGQCPIAFLHVSFVSSGSNLPRELVPHPKSFPPREKEERERMSRPFGVFFNVRVTTSTSSRSPDPDPISHTSYGSGPRSSSSTVLIVGSFANQ